MVVPLDKAVTEMIKAGWLWKTGQLLIRELMSLISHNNNVTMIFSVYVSSKDSLPSR